MLDGKYQASLNTPMGAITGNITLMCRENKVQGTIETMGMKNSFQGEKLNENQCKFTGKFNTPLGAIDYSATCIVTGNKLELMANTNKGNFKLEGKRV
ncbi:MAG: hypothetical protein HFJ53_00815 [Clostridia bacterium]|jgi:hypothetical protein|nr:hypothetical protein [Clostridia bacterium]